MDDKSITFRINQSGNLDYRFEDEIEVRDVTSVQGILQVEGTPCGQAASKQVVRPREPSEDITRAVSLHERTERNLVTEHGALMRNCSSLGQDLYERVTGAPRQVSFVDIDNTDKKYELHRNKNGKCDG